MDTIRVQLKGVHEAYRILGEVWQAIKPALIDDKALHLEVRDEKRSDPQNRLMWAMLGEISRGVEWHGSRLTDEEWKDVFTAALKQQRAVPGICGGFVVLGTRTSKMSRAEMAELIALMSAFAVERGVEIAA